MDLGEWLLALGLERYAQEFRDNEGFGTADLERARAFLAEASQ